MNTANFEKFMEREFNSFLKELNRLNLLSTSIKDTKSRLLSGDAYECKVKSTKVGRPKKSKLREPTESDVISDLTAKAESKPKAVSKPKKAKKAKMSEEEKAAAKEAKLQAKAAKLQAKADAKAAKLKEKEEKKALAAKLREEKKQQKLLLKEQKKAAKLAAKKEAAQTKKAKAKAELERKQKEAQALMDKPDVPITNSEGEVVGSKVESFNLPEEQAELKQDDSVLPEGFKQFQHKSRPNESLYLESNDQSVYTRKGDDLEHIGYFDEASDTIIPPSDDELEEELSDTE